MIQNPQIESNLQGNALEKTGQLNVNLTTQSKANITKIDFLFTDFRVVLAFPTIKALLYSASSAMKATNALQSKLAKNLPAEPKITVKEETAIKSGSLEIKGKIENVEVWLPEEVK